MKHPLLLFPDKVKFWVMLSVVSSFTTAGLLAAPPRTSPNGRHFPMTHRWPQGQAGHWAMTINPTLAKAVQSVQIQLPSQGEVTFYNGSQHEPLVMQAPAQAGLMVGQVYRFRISDMPEFPGSELYPTVELISRLHPPQGAQDRFPIEIPITQDEMEAVLEHDQMVTKVIYLEQPQFAAEKTNERGHIVEDLPPTANLLTEADFRGRPLAILRIGGRTLDPNSRDNSFFESMAPVMTTTSTSGNIQQTAFEQPVASFPNLTGSSLRRGQSLR